MSDLQCPARVFVTRPAQATSAGPGVTRHAGGRLTHLGSEEAWALAERLRTERVAAVYTSGLGPAVDTGALVARALGVRAHVRPGLEELAPAEPVAEALARMAAALDDVADRHRGEAVLAVSHPGMTSLVLPRLAANGGVVSAAPPPLAPGEVVALERDADGWRLTAPWPGGPGALGPARAERPAGAQKSRERTSSMPRSAS